MKTIVHHADCRKVMDNLADATFDGIVTDSPYGYGIRGKGWDHGVPGAEYWERALRVTKPGGYMFCFGGPRTFHRLTSAIEDSGWAIHQVVSWLYGTGFPKHANHLKTAWEPIILARHPKAGATPLNIDSCRLGKERWPADVVVDDEVAELLGRVGQYFYCAKASRAEREAGLEKLPKREGGVTYKGFTKDVARGQDRNRPVHNPHPTVKPLALTRWLLRLIVEPGGVVFDPFTGSGTTGAAAVMEGCSFVGAETDKNDVAVARARIRYAKSKARKK